MKIYFVSRGYYGAVWHGITVRLDFGKSTIRNYVRNLEEKYGTVRKYGIIFSVPYRGLSVLQ